MQRILGFFKSMRLAVALIAILAAGSALATVVPQGLRSEEYIAGYGRTLGGILVGSGMSRYFRSPLFLAPAFLFFANLSACSVDRLIRELRKKGRRRHGPDLLHLGLMLLVIGALLSFSGRREGAVSLAEGEVAGLPDGRLLRMDRIDYLAYEDGRPRDWISRVTVLRDGKAEIEGYSIRVNNPLRLGGVALYQSSYGIEGGVERSGIKAVADPGYALVLAALVIACAGTFLTFLQKLGDTKP